MEKTQSLPPNQIAAQEIRYVDTHRISCNGGGGALGHPLVWYSLEDGKAQCGYCDVQFVYRPANN